MKGEEIARLNIDSYELKTYLLRESKSEVVVMILAKEGFDWRKINVPISLSDEILEDMQLNFAPVLSL